MKAIGYVRVSTEKRADFGVSLEAQQVRGVSLVSVAESLNTGVNGLGFVGFEGTV